jgi:hypothetical protein
MGTLDSVIRDIGDTLNIDFEMALVLDKSGSHAINWRYAEYGDAEYK